MVTQFSVIFNRLFAAVRPNKEYASFLIVGGLTVDRWFKHIDIMVAVMLVLYTAVGVGAAYVQSIVALFIVFFIQGTVETWLQTGTCPSHISVLTK